MSDVAATGAQPTERARAWRTAMLASVCDVVEPWAYGTVFRSTRYPTYYEYNVVRVEQQLSMSVEELVAFADRALAGLEHRRIDFDLVNSAEPLRRNFLLRGWRCTRLLWMAHTCAAPPAVLTGVEEVSYDAVAHLRLAWHREDSPEEEWSEFHAVAREVSLSRHARIFAARRGGVPVAFAQLERLDRGSEITEVYVHAGHRGHGLGTAVTSAAITAAEVDELWICADDGGRPKNLYARLGFRTAWTTMQFLRPPA